ncbi:hypothetical protein SAMN05660235_02480 [Sporolituus thermophilus DSM 23256]|uniref:Uncharacterized protein n=1 Tax=Sporolituus thermophilus DSM 23256 TaxID=1123285 RepID=A0A1G7NAQ7_9FIRM|nr:hypothetical protein SAMN05660235_02480 [Sporolituus thermophilus DSM 23256]
MVDLALVADKNNAELKQLSQRLQLLSGIGKEFERASRDDRLFPLVILDAMRWFHEEFDLLTDFKDSLLTMASEQYLSDTPMFNELYAAGIVYLKKKYPCLYRYYQERWQELFKQKTAGLNRDERRSLRL